MNVLARLPRVRTQILAGWILGIGVCFLAGSATAFPQSSVENQILTIEEDYYYEGNYREAIVLLDRLLATPGMGSFETVQARSLKARCLINLDRVEEARKLFEQNLAADPAWGLDPTLVLDREYAIYQDVREKYLMAQTGAAQTELRQMNSRIAGLERENPELKKLSSSSGGKKFYENWWFTLLTAAAVGGVVAAVVSSGDDETPPPPPDPTTGTIEIGIPVSSVVIW